MKEFTGYEISYRGGTDAFMRWKYPGFRNQDLRIFSGLALLLAFVSVAIAIYLTIERSSGRNQFRLEESKLKGAGLLLPVSALLPPPAAGAVDNGRTLLALFEATEDAPGLNSPLLNGPILLRFTAPGIISPAATEPEPLMDSPTFSLSWSELDRQFATIASVLDGASRLLRSPIALDYNYQSLDAQQDLGAAQKLAALFRTGTILRLQKGDPFNPTATISEMQILSELIGSPKMLIHHVLELGVWSYAVVPTTWEVLQVGGLSEIELEKLQEIFSRGHFVEGAILAMKVEFSVAPLVFGQMTKEGALAQLPAPPGLLGSKPLLAIRDALWPHVWVDGDLARTFAFWRRSILQAEEVLETRNWRTVQTGFASGETEPSPYEVWRFPGTELFLNDGLTFSFLRSSIQAETRRQLALAAIAVSRYHLARGEYPETLAELVPDYLSDLPHDWFDGQPLKYKRLPDGAFLLYSVNEDGADDGGDATPADGQSPTFGNGRDLVWPRTAVLRQ